MEPRASAAVRLAWYAAVVALTVGYLAYNFRLHDADLTAPLNRAQGDAAALLTLVTAVQEGGWPWVVDRVGAPGVAERLDYPVPEHAHTLTLRLIFQFTDNPFLAFNLWALLSYPLTAVCTFGVLRALGISRPVGFAVAIVFTFLPYHASRVFSQTFLAHYHTVPLVALPAVWITQGRLPFFGPPDEVGRRFTPWTATTGWTLLIAGLVAVTSAYYAFFGCFFLAVAGLYRGLNEGSWRPVGAGLGTAAAIAAVGFACTLPFVLYQREHGENPAVARRNANEAEVYALKVTQLVLPTPGHRLNALGHITRTYNADAPHSNENRDSSLGLIGAVGFLVLLGRLLGPRPGVTLLGGLAVLNVAAVLLGTSGGLGALFNFAVFPQIRCYNRVCVFVAFWSLLAVAVLVDRWLGERKSVRTPMQSASDPFRGPARLAALGLLVVGLWDTTSRHQAPNHAELRANHAAWRGFVGRMEAELPPGGMVFQLPAASYPEAGPVHQMPDYAHLACHGYSRALRWSFGTNRNRRWAEWQESVAGLPTPEMVQALAATGFAGVYVDRRGFADSGAAVVAELRSLLGPEVAVSDAGRQLLFSLAGVAPTADGDRLLNRPCVLCQAGFLPWAPTSPPQPRRALHVAELRLVNPGDRPRRVTLSMRWHRVNPADLVVRVTGPGIDRDETPPADRSVWRVDLDLPPGEHLLRFEATPRPAGPARFHVAWDATDIRLIERD